MLKYLQWIEYITLAYFVNKQNMNVKKQIPAVHLKIILNAQEDTLLFQQCKESVTYNQESPSGL